MEEKKSIKKRVKRAISENEDYLDFLKTPYIKETIVTVPDTRTKEEILSSSLGNYVGEYIVSEYLPSLSIDYWEEVTQAAIRRNKVFVVSEEDVKKYNEIDKKLHSWEKNNRKYYREDWNEYIIFRNELCAKYLPAVLKCYIPGIDLDSLNIKHFKNAIKRALWDSDRCNYHSKTDEDILIEEKNEIYSGRLYKNIYISLKLDSTPNIVQKGEKDMLEKD